MKTLYSMKPGETGMISKMDGGMEFNRKLRNIGIREGKQVRVVARQYLGGPLVIEIGGRQITIGRGMAGRIFVDA